MKKRTIAALLLLLITTITVTYFAGKYVQQNNSEIENVVINNTDTVFKTDTLKFENPKPQISEVIRYDTIKTFIYSENKANRIRADSNDSARFIIPITRSTYDTEEYKAVIEGYKPKLVSLAVYPKTTTIYNTQEVYRKPRFAFTVGAGLGYSAGGLVRPCITATIGYVLWGR